MQNTTDVTELIDTLWNVNTPAEVIRAEGI